ELGSSPLQPGDLRRMRDDPKTKAQVFRYPFPGTWYLIPQVTKPPFDNVKVRRAVGHAIDRESVVKVADGFAIPAHSMIPTGFPGAVDDKKIRDIQRFDPKAAMAMLQGTPFEAGHDTRDTKKRLVNYAKAEEIMQTDGGYVPVAWVSRWCAAKPAVRGLEKNKLGETVVEGNIYVDMLPHLYMVEKV